MLVVCRLKEQHLKIKSAAINKLRFVTKTKKLNVRCSLIPPCRRSNWKIVQRRGTDRFQSEPYPYNLKLHILSLKKKAVSERAAKIGFSRERGELELLEPAPSLDLGLGSGLKFYFLTPFSN